MALSIIVIFTLPTENKDDLIGKIFFLTFCGNVLYVSSTSRETKFVTRIVTNLAS